MGMGVVTMLLFKYFGLHEAKQWTDKDVYSQQ